MGDIPGRKCMNRLLEFASSWTKYCTRSRSKTLFNSSLWLFRTFQVFIVVLKRDSVEWLEAGGLFPPSLRIDS